MFARASGEQPSSSTRGKLLPKAYFSPTLDQKGLSPCEVRALGCIARHARSGAWQISNRQLALATGLSQVTVWRVVSKFITDRLVRGLGAAGSPRSAKSFFNDNDPFRVGTKRRLRLTHSAARAIRVPSEVDDAGLSVGAFRLLFHVVSCESGTDGCRHSLRCLQERVRMHRLTIKRSIAELIKGGWLVEKARTLTSRFHAPHAPAPVDLFKPHKPGVDWILEQTPTRRQAADAHVRIEQLYNEAQEKDRVKTG